MVYEVVFTFLAAACCFSANCFTYTERKYPHFQLHAHTHLLCLPIPLLQATYIYTHAHTSTYVRTHTHTHTHARTHVCECTHIHYILLNKTNAAKFRFPQVQIKIINCNTKPWLPQLPWRLAAPLVPPRRRSELYGGGEGVSPNMAARRTLPVSPPLLPPPLCLHRLLPLSPSLPFPPYSSSSSSRGL